MSRTAVILWLVITLAGLVARGWNLSRLGLVHFDEGIYATAAANPIDPGLIAYAPPGYPTVVAIAYRILGASDTAAILVSILAGTAAIPMIGWLSSRAGGANAGPWAAGLAAVWGGQIAFSRMALTDASFLAAWLAGLIASARWLERPTIGRALLAGLMIGLAQNTKYNGWLLIPVLVAASALPSGPAGPTRRRRIVGLIVAAAMAALLFFPWFRFVDDHGGYRALLRHQSGYVDGWRAWPRNLLIQLDQVEALSGLPDWGLAGRLGIATAVMVGLLSPLPDRWRRPVRSLAMVGLAMVPSAAWWVAMLAVPFRLVDSKPAGRILAGSWLVLTVLTPLYHPYARLWLPLQATSLAIAASWVFEPGCLRGKDGRSWPILVAVAALLFLGLVERGRPLPGLFDHSDSLRTACRSASALVMEEPDRVPTLARPSSLFYLATEIPIARLENADSARSVRAFGPSAWLLIDEVQWRQDDPRGEPIDPGRWRVAGRWPTSLNLPTWLDVDPAAATRPSTARDAALILYRPPRLEADR